MAGNMTSKTSKTSKRLFRRRAITLTHGQDSMLHKHSNRDMEYMT
jgi:hypothetical protein